MRIGFDAKRLFNNFTGLGNYSRFVVNALIDHAAQHQYLLYTPRRKDHPDTFAITEHGQVSVHTPPLLYTLTGTSSLWRTWGLSKDASVKTLSVFHGLSQELPHQLPSGIRKLVTIHDLIFMRFPKLYSSIDASIYRAKMSHACKVADEIIAISQQTAEDLMSYLDVPASRIKVIYQGCHPQFRKILSPEALHYSRKKYGLPGEYMLNVGTVEERKNIILAIKAMALLPETARLPLVIVGRETAYKHEVVNVAAKLNLSPLLIFIHGVPFDDLPGLYQGALVFLYPSIFEGFGIPVVEALESGVPVITSTGSCFREAGGPGSIYVEPTREDELAFQISRVIGDQSLRQQMIAQGKEFVTRFAPAMIAKELLELYEMQRVKSEW
ncbi:MAG TPA: glycosyltransferase family 1 protein [Chryseolinea sp.]|nr:glycosyltransferase family 1 protein [Chryseolinea sp.]